jgi:hypothetical protein
MVIKVTKDEETQAQYESELRFQLDQNSRMNHAVKEERFKLATKLLDVLDVKTIAEKFEMAVEEVEALRGNN